MKSIILNISFGFLISILGLNNIFAQQNVGISETPITPDITSILEVYSTSKGILIPRLTSYKEMLLLLQQMAYWFFIQVFIALCFLELAIIYDNETEL